MTAPTTFDFAVIQIGAGTGPETWTTICGIQTVGFTRTVNTDSRFVRDCTSPAAIPERRLRVTGFQRTLTGSGLANSAQTSAINALEGKRNDYRVQIMDISDPTVPAGVLLGTWTGFGIATSIQLSTSDTNEATIELTIESDGPWVYTAAP